MSGRFKPYSLIVLGMLLAAFLLNPPVAFATKLPTACNVFNKKQIEKSGPCKHFVIFSKDKCYENGLALVSDMSPGITHPGIVQNSHYSILLSPEIILSTSPLRC
jgi:hypothetical protein